MTRARRIIDNPKFGGSPCPVTKEVQECSNAVACPPTPAPPRTPAPATHDPIFALPYRGVWHPRPKTACKHTRCFFKVRNGIKVMGVVHHKDEHKPDHRAKKHCKFDRTTQTCQCACAHQPVLSSHQAACANQPFSVACLREQRSCKTVGCGFNGMYIGDFVCSCQSNCTSTTDAAQPDTKIHKCCSDYPTVCAVAPTVHVTVHSKLACAPGKYVQGYGETAWCVQCPQGRYTKYANQHTCSQKQTLPSFQDLSNGPEPALDDDT